MRGEGGGEKGKRREKDEERRDGEGGGEAETVRGEVGGVRAVRGDS